MTLRSQGFETFRLPGYGLGAPQSPYEQPSAPREGVEHGAPPSSYAVVDLLDGQPGSVVRIVGLTALRGCFIIPGLWVASRLMRVEMEPMELLGLSFAGSGTITIGMITYYALRRATG